MESEELEVHVGVSELALNSGLNIAARADLLQSSACPEIVILLLVTKVVAVVSVVPRRSPAHLLLHLTQIQFQQSLMLPIVAPMIMISCMQMCITHSLF